MINYSRHLSDEHKKALDRMLDLLNAAYEAMIYNIEHYNEIKDIEKAKNAELAIDAFKKECKLKEYDSMEKKGDLFRIRILPRHSGRVGKHRRLCHQRVGSSGKRVVNVTLSPLCGWVKVMDSA